MIDRSEISWGVSDLFARDSITTVFPSEVGRLCFVMSEGSYWRLTNNDPITWEKVEE